MAIEKESFQKINKHIIKIEDEYRKNDALCDEQIDQFVINFGEDSESELDEFWADEPPYQPTIRSDSSSLNSSSDDSGDDLPGPSSEQ